MWTDLLGDFVLEQGLDPGGFGWIPVEIHLVVIDGVKQVNLVPVGERSYYRRRTWTP